MYVRQDPRSVISFTIPGTLPTNDISSHKSSLELIK